MESNASQQNDNFDRLAADLTKQERFDILDQLKRSKLELAPPLSEEEIKEKTEAEIKQELETKLKAEPLLFRIFIYIKSLFAGVTQDKAYNSFIVSSLTKRLEKQSPTLLDSKKQAVGEQLLDALSELKDAQEFFEPYFKKLKGKIGVFYFILGDMVMPEFGAKVKDSCDVYTFPVNKPLAPETRNFILSKLDALLSEVNQQRQDRMLECARSFEWLRAFCELPLKQMVERFTSKADGGLCSYVRMQLNYDEFLKVLAYPVVCADEMLACLLAAQDLPGDLWAYAYASSEETNAFLKASSSRISVMSSCAKKIPLESLGKVIFENALYAAPENSYGENWLTRFREQWRVVLDRRWRNWNKDYKTGVVKKKIKVYFGLTALPTFPATPWKGIKLETEFRHELTLGFTNFYLQNELPKYRTSLDAILVEGEFAIKENRQEFADCIAALDSVTASNDSVLQKASFSGDWGERLAKLENTAETNDGDKKRAEELVREIEDYVFAYLSSFSNCLKTFQNLLLALLGEKTTVYYGPLANLMKIKGKENKDFRATMEKFVHSVKFADEVLSILQSIEKT